MRPTLQRSLGPILDRICLPLCEADLSGQGTQPCGPGYSIRPITWASPTPTRPTLQRSLGPIILKWTRATLPRHQCGWHSRRQTDCRNQHIPPYLVLQHPSPQVWRDYIHKGGVGNTRGERQQKSHQDHSRWKLNLLPRWRRHQYSIIRAHQTHAQ